MTPSRSTLHHALQGTFAERWQALLLPRPWTPGFDPRSVAVRQSEWRVVGPTPELAARRVEQLVEASSAQALEEALAAGPDALIFDFDDTFSPTPENVRRGYANLEGFPAAGGPIPMLRPRPLYMHDPSPASGGTDSATIRDLWAFAGAFAEREFLYVYVPKLEFPDEAEFWQDLLSEVERQSGRAPGSIRVCLQIETLPGAFHAEELLFALRNRAFGLNAGRWDYVFSSVKWLGQDRGFCLPPRAELHMGQPAMQAYEAHLARVCARRGAQAIGGTAALAPDPANPGPALAVVRADKEREAAQGYVAAWAGLPGLIPTVRAVFQSPPGGSSPSPLPEEQVAAALLAFPQAGVLPHAAVREAVSVAVEYFRAWLGGQGVTVREGRVEDTATAELARAQLWQWVQRGLGLDTGEVLTPQRFEAELAAHAGPHEPAARLLRALVLAPTCPASFPLVVRAFDEVNC